MQELLYKLCALSGASGDEAQVRDFIRHAAAPHASEIHEDALGNLIVFKKGKSASAPRLMLAAHMDEVGLMVKSITDEGYLKFVTLGGIDRRVLLAKRVLVGANQLSGVIGLKAYHLLTGDEGKSAPKLSDLYIDLGFDSREEAEAAVSLGDSIVFAQDPADFGAGLLRAKAIDDRLGCAVMLALLPEDLPMDLHFAFTVQEEIGTRGAFAASFALVPDIALVLEGTTAADLPDIKGQKRVCALGAGPVIPFMDGATIYDRGLFELLRSLAIEHDIPWQTKHQIAGGTDAGTIQRSRAGVRVAGLSAAVRYLHTSEAVASLRDAADMLRMARLFIDAVSTMRKKEG